MFPRYGWYSLYQGWFPVFSFRKVMLHVLIKKGYYHGSFTRSFFFFWEVSVIVLAWFIFCVSPARLGKASMRIFSCSQPQILVELIRYDLLRFFCTTVWCPCVFHNGFVTHTRIRWRGGWPRSELLGKRSTSARIA